MRRSSLVSHVPFSRFFVAGTPAVSEDYAARCIRFSATREMQQRIRHDATRRRRRMQPELQCHFGECVQPDAALNTRRLQSSWQERAERAARHAYFAESLQKRHRMIKIYNRERSKFEMIGIDIYICYYNWEDKLYKLRNKYFIKMGLNGKGDKLK